MNIHPRLTGKFLLRTLLVFSVFPFLFFVLTQMICFWGISYLVLHYDIETGMKFSPVLYILPLVAAFIGYAVGLKISSRIFSRAQMYEILAGLKPTPRSIKSANKTLDRLYPK